MPAAPTSTTSTRRTPTPASAGVGYGADPQPVRNGDVANLVLDVLGLPAIPDSELDADQDLEVFETPSTGPAVS